MLYDKVKNVHRKLVLHEMFYRVLKESNFARAKSPSKVTYKIQNVLMA